MTWCTLRTKISLHFYTLKRAETVFCSVFGFCTYFVAGFVRFAFISVVTLHYITLHSTVLALGLEGVQDVKLHHPSSSVATSNQ